MVVDSNKVFFAALATTGGVHSFSPSKFIFMTFNDEFENVEKYKLQITLANE